MQVKVGASNYSQPCAYCLGEQLMATAPGGQGRWWLGAVNGTAIHGYLEERAKQLRPAWEPEQKVVMGVLPGYGTIKSTTDLYIPEQAFCGDYKTTTKEKLKWIKEALTHPQGDFELSTLSEARYKCDSYLNQLMSYGRGLILAGKNVEWVGLMFVCRDGKEDADVWGHTVPYDAEQAEFVWSRLERLWAWLQEGNDRKTLPQHPYCYTCNHRED
jgi:hypothetical protein